MFATLGRFTHRHRWAVLGGWIMILALGFTVGSGVFSHLSESQGSSSTESVKGAEILAEHGPTAPGVIAVVSGRPVEDRQVRAAVRRTTEEVAALPYVTDVANAYDNNLDPALRSAEGNSSLVAVTLEATDTMDEAHARVDELREIFHDSVPGAEVLVGGDEPVMRDEMVTAQEDLVKGQMVALPLLLLALLLVFRGWRSASLPLLGAVVTVGGALLVLLGATRFIDVSSYAVDTVVLFGLALAVDYSLLMVSRFREEKAAGGTVAEVVERTVAAAGRTITYSALTVIASLSGLFVFETPVFQSLAVGGISTVLVALGAGLTLVPAMLALWGRRINAEARSEVKGGAFGRLARKVQRRPLLVAAGVTAALLAAGAPFLGVSYSSGDHRVLPTSVESRRATDLMVAEFPATGTGPVQVVAERPADDPEVQEYVDAVSDLPGVVAASAQPLGEDSSVVSVVPDGETQGEEAQALVHDLRRERPAYDTWVTGQAAFLVDFSDHIADRLPYAAVLIGLSTFVLLFLMTGSLLVPLKALVMNTLSLGATFGALVWIFQDGNLSGLLDFTAFGAIEVWVPIIVFVFAFGLSMDYEVFLLSRIKEAFDKGMTSDEAVAAGLQRSGRIITSAAVLVMIAFLGFAVGDNLGIKEMGLALAIAVAVDATLVRCLLVPATMTLLGERNWWAPRWMRRFHDRYGLHEVPETARPDLPVEAAA
jgi:putative drug exporter of the RND superfamily